MGQMQIAYQILLRKPEGKSRLEGLRATWATNIKMRLNEMWIEDVD
jgi:hypothetical protein